MAEAAKLICLTCGIANRVPLDRLGSGPKCGTCGAKLADGRVTDLSPDVLEKAARTDEVPLVVDFWAPWCGPCRMMAPEFAKAARSLAPQVRFAKINTEQFPQVSASRNIRGIPLLIVYHRGREVARQAGAMPAAGIEAFVRMKVPLTA